MLCRFQFTIQALVAKGPAVGLPISVRVKERVVKRTVALVRALAVWQVKKPEPWSGMEKTFIRHPTQARAVREQAVMLRTTAPATAPAAQRTAALAKALAVEQV